MRSGHPQASSSPQPQPEALKATVAKIRTYARTHVSLECVGPGESKPFWLQEDIKRQQVVRIAMQFLVGLLVAWSALCAYVGLLAGCWWSRRSSSRSDAEPMKDELNTDPSPPCAPPVPKCSPGTSMAAGRQTLYHTQMEGTMLHTRPNCKGLLNRRRDRHLVSRVPCSLCCGGVEIIPP